MAAVAVRRSTAATTPNIIRRDAVAPGAARSRVRVVASLRPPSSHREEDKERIRGIADGRIGAGEGVPTRRPSWAPPTLALGLGDDRERCVRQRRGAPHRRVARPHGGDGHLEGARRWTRSRCAGSTSTVTSRPTSASTVASTRRSTSTPSEDYEWWSSKLGHVLEPGTFGENLTVAGFDPSDAVIGTRWRIGAAEFEVSQPRLPCFKLGMRMGDVGVRRRVRGGGAVRRVPADRRWKVTSAPATRSRPSDPARGGITVRELGNADRGVDRAFLERVLADAAVPERWHEWARRQMTRQ